MNYLNEEVVLNFYLEQLKLDNINYLKGRQKYKNKIESHIIELRECNKIHKKIDIAKALWKVLFEAAMSDIDPDKRGYDKLFKYFDEYVNFEELIFASDSFYRDHTLHCLWVYFLGEYIMKHAEFDSITLDMDNEYFKLRKILELFNDNGLGELIEDVSLQLNLSLQSSEKVEAVRCIAALTHDLGYPLKKIEKINKCMKNVLPFFSINNFDEFAFNYTDMEQIYIKEFIEYLSQEFISHLSLGKANEIFGDLFIHDKNSDIGVSLNADLAKTITEDQIKTLKKDIKIEGYLANSKANFWRYSQDFEEYKHGIMSAFLLIKNVASMSNCSLKERDYKDINMKNKYLVRDTLKKDILNAIADHTSNGYQINSICTTSSFLTFIDELEEFSRISRANQNREYVEEFCATNIYMKDGWLNVDFIFDNESIDNLDPERAFKGRCGRFLSLFDIPNLSEKINLRVSCIGELESNRNKYVLEIAKRYAKITINDKEQDIPKYLKKSEFYSREEYELL